MTTIGTFSPKLGHLFPIFEERQGRPPPLTPSSYAPGCFFYENLFELTLSAAMSDVQDY